MYNWLRKKCENCSIAEMSIWYSITVVGSFIIIFLLWGLFVGIPSADDEDVSIVQTAALVVALLLWLVFILWLWIGLVRTVWRWNSAKLGYPIFRFLQKGFLVMVIMTALLQKDLREDLKMLSYILLSFDIAIMFMIFNFLLLAWVAQVKIPSRVYWEIASISTMVILQAWIII